jgi:uncharacterized integral membrane protein
MRTLLSKFIGHLAFIGLALILLPLAVQNRQIVSLTLDPLALLTGQAGRAFQLPLFIALLLALALGLTVGYGWARVSQSRFFRAKKAPQSVDLSASSPLLKPDPVLENRKHRETIAGPAKEEKANVDIIE